ncbi:DedA family protein [Campylobacter sp. MIT 99-7217]|uniref:YqaA family protein n=1 Tax=Campylobacter sp. MIT 99-7217 TaxID=535091 RepID=UPI001158B6A7|nr:YqaA family protein [Campylobacter sp. MIT 99-7217]TQR29040.1 DedA family protein [Campylobacter sp. MIT 99-7217]
MFDTLLQNLSYGGLFLISFISATLYPLASEAFVVGFVVADFSPFWVLFIASLGNTLGSLSTYALAFFGKSLILEKYFSKPLQKLSKMNANFKKFGCFYAFLSFLPLVGDIFVLGLGLSKYSFLKATFFIALGKIFRYLVLIFSALYFA